MTQPFACWRRCRRSGAASALRLGDVALSNVELYSADLPVLTRLGIEDGGLLGNDLLDDFARIEVDFENEVLRVWR